MNRNLNKFDRLLIEKIESLEGSINEDLWENIEKQLDRDDAGIYKKKYRILKSSFLALLFLFLSYATFTIIQIKSLKEHVVAQKNTPLYNKQIGRKNYSDIDRNNVDKNETALAMVSSSIAHGDNHNLVVWHNRNKNSKSNGINIYRPKQLIPASILSSSPKKNEELLRSNNSSSHKFLTLESGNNQIATVETDIPKKPFYFDSIANKVQPNLSSCTFINQNNTSNQSETLAEKKSKLKASPSSRVFIGAFFAPTHSGYNLEDDEDNQYDNKEKIQGRENDEFSYSAGVVLGYQLRKHLSIQSGITFSSSNISIAKSNIFAEKNNSGDIKFRYNTSSGYSYFLPSFNTKPSIGDSLSSGLSNMVIQYIGIPLTAKYIKEKGRYKFGIETGISLNFLTRSIVETEVKSYQNVETETITRLQGLRNINVSFLLSPEVQYSLSQRLAISARPCLKYSLIPINKGHIVKTYSYDSGLSIGVNYHLLQ